MPKIIVQANQSDSDAGRVTLGERVVATHLPDDHYATQLIERLDWSAIDAERLESPTNRAHADEHRELQPTRATVPSRSISSRPRSRPVAGTHGDST